MEQLVTAEYLLNHGFMEYKSEEEGYYWQIPFDDNEGSRCFREIDGGRQLFVVIFSAYNGDPKDGWHRSVYVQEDAGCGFVEIPFPWSDLSVEFFESVFYGIRGHKPKYTGPPVEDIQHEVIKPKLLNL